MNYKITKIEVLLIEAINLAIIISYIIASSPFEAVVG